MTIKEIKKKTDPIFKMEFPTKDQIKNALNYYATYEYTNLMMSGFSPDYRPNENIMVAVYALNYLLKGEK